MVTLTRKPVASSPVPPQGNAAAAAPLYPVSPTMPFQAAGMHPGYTHPETSDSALPEDAHARSRSNSDASVDTWNSGSSSDKDYDALPEPLTPSKRTNGHGDGNHIPATLRPGIFNDMSRPSRDQALPSWSDNEDPWAEPRHSSETSQRPLQSHNPYLQIQKTGQQQPPPRHQSLGAENSQAVWNEAPSHPPPPPPTSAPPAPPPALPAFSTPVDELAGLSFNEPALPSSGSRNSPLPYPDTNTLLPIAQDFTGHSAASQRSNISNPWQEDLNRGERQDSDETRPNHASDMSLLDIGDALPKPWTSSNMGEPPLQTPPSIPVVKVEEPGPPKPPRKSFPSLEESAPPKPPRPAPIDVSRHGRSVSAQSEPGTPSSQARRQRNENYQIKHINWYDAASAGGGHGKGMLRGSPILVQNANGPCPLLALVNALVLTTPQDFDTSLVDTLRSREQVTLGLLLDAVFEELVRRCESSGHDLPDIGELYSFLITLHTGMNVNPRFVSPSQHARGSLEVNREVSIEGMHPIFRSQAKPGTFEETREMRLYSTFDIPLIHGWTLPPDSAMYAAFDRSAQTFEDAQNMQFREEELEDKLRTQCLSVEEQQIFEDVASIKHFLTTYPTQLTDYGLEVMSKAMLPGQIAILFRNDHFATLYKEPQSGALMTLVTDAGYSTHDEIVWESLVDVNGASSELFAGDFRPVGSTSSTSPAPVQAQYLASGMDDGWETVQPRIQRNARNQVPAPSTPVGRKGAVDVPAQFSAETSGKTTEQEDHDLALALQLQEEEEDSHRRDAAARRQREEDLSRQFLDREQTEQPPAMPPRRNTRAASSPNSPAAAAPQFAPPTTAPPSSSSAADDNVPPPSYEQAASDRPYRPSGATPHPHQTRQGDALGALGALQAQQQQSAFAAQSNLSVNSYGNGGRPVSPAQRRRSSGYQGPGNRIRRQQSTPGGFPGVVGTTGNGSAMGSSPPYSPAAYSAGASAPAYDGQSAVTGNRVEQEKCVVM